MEAQLRHQAGSKGPWLSLLLCSLRGSLRVAQRAASELSVRGAVATNFLLSLWMQQLLFYFCYPSLVRPLILLWSECKIFSTDLCVQILDSQMLVVFGRLWNL